MVWKVFSKYKNCQYSCNRKTFPLFYSLALRSVDVCIVYKKKEKVSKNNHCAPVALVPRSTLLQFSAKYHKSDEFSMFSIQVRGAACRQLEIITDATASLGESMTKSIKSCGQDAEQIARSISEIVDPEDILKSIHSISHTEQTSKKTPVTIHKPIGMSNQKTFSNRPLEDMICEEDEDSNTSSATESFVNTDDADEKDVSVASSSSSITKTRAPCIKNKMSSKSFDETSSNRSSGRTIMMMMRQTGKSSNRYPFNRNKTLNEH